MCQQLDTISKHCRHRLLDSPEYVGVAGACTDRGGHVLMCPSFNNLSGAQRQTETEQPVAVTCVCGSLFSRSVQRCGGPRTSIRLTPFPGSGLLPLVLSVWAHLSASLPILVSWPPVPSLLPIYFLSCLGGSSLKISLFPGVLDIHLHDLGVDNGFKAHRSHVP